MTKKDLIYVGILVVLALALWSIPSTKSTYPYGEGDATHQYGEADWRATEDTAQRAYPDFLARWYGPNQNDYHAPGNAPPFGILVAFVQQLSLNSFLIKNLFLVFIGIIPVTLGTYLLIRKLYNSDTAFLAAFPIMFSQIDIYAHLFGQRLVLFSTAFIPLILYCVYSYTQEKRLYHLILAAVFTAAGAIIHPQMLAIVFFAILIYGTYWVFKTRSFPFRHALLAVMIIIILLLPFIPDWTTQKQSSPGKIGFNNISDLFKFYPHSSTFDKLGGPWIFFAMLIGLIFMLFNHKERDILMLSWFIALYLSLHLGVIGVYENRIDRFFKAAAPMIFSFAAVFISYIPSLYPKKFFKESLSAFFILFLILTAGIPAYHLLSSAYPPQLRMNDHQYEAALWIKDNIPDGKVIYTLGSLTYPKQRWMNMLSHKEFEVNHPQEGDGQIYKNTSYILVDYSDGINPIKMNDWIQYNNLTKVIHNWSGDLVLYER